MSWSGLVIGEYHHGYVLACERHRGGIAFSADEQTIGRDALRRALDGRLSPSEHGILRMSVEGRLGYTYGQSYLGKERDAPILRIAAVRRIWFERMTPAEIRALLQR